MKAYTFDKQPVIVAQLGARMHYAVPRILHEAGLLQHFFTDICATKGWPSLLRLVPKKARSTQLNRLLSRVPYGVPPSLITTFSTFGFEYARRLRNVKSHSDAVSVFLWADQEFCRLVNLSSWKNASAVYTFNNAGLEIMKQARQRGIATIMEQTIAPHELECQLLQQEQERNPGWQRPSAGNHIASYSERQQREWEVADLIICGSEFVKDGIKAVKGPSEKCVVVPYGVDFNGPANATLPTPSYSSRENHNNRPLRVLSVGSVGLRKGAPYVYEAAKALQGRAEFRWVGGVSLTSEAVQKMQKYVQLLGITPRSEMHRHYEWADVFLLPSICEGSATVTYEALTWGLPVICTPNTGSVVRPGIDGELIPIADSTAIIAQLSRFIENSDLIKQISTNARARSEVFTTAAYSRRLLNALASLFGESH